MGERESDVFQASRRVYDAHPGISHLVAGQSHETPSPGYKPDYVSSPF
jgi:hypothetical protein